MTKERIWIHRSVAARDLAARGFGTYYPEPVINDVGGEGVEYARVRDVADQPEVSEARLRNQAENIVGTVFDNTGASHETLKQIMVERITAALIVAYRSGNYNAGYVAGMEKAAEACDERAEFNKSQAEYVSRAGRIGETEILTTRDQEAAECAATIRALITPPPTVTPQLHCSCCQREQDSTKEHDQG